MANDVYFSDLDLERLLNQNVIYAYDSENVPVILIKSSQAGNKPDSRKWSSLKLLTNRKCRSDKYDFTLHIVSPVHESEYQSFPEVYRYVFEQIREPVKAEDLFTIIQTLNDFFSAKPEKNLKAFRIGLYGELLCLLKLYDLGWDQAFGAYHKNFSNKTDFEITPTLRLEVKTTTSFPRIHRFAHDQLVRDDADVYILSVVLEASDQGCSLLELLEEILTKHRNALNLETYFLFLALKKIAAVGEDDPGPAFAREKAEGNIKAFINASLPHIDMSKPIPGVTDLKYSVNCDLGQDTPLDELVEILNGALI